MLGNTAIEETELASRVAQKVAAALPTDWTTRLIPGEANRRPELEVISSSGESATFGIVIGHSGNIPATELVVPESPGSAGILFISKYIPGPTRDKLEKAGISYADTTGWVKIVSARPMLAIVAQGSRKSPRPSTTEAVTKLNGRASGRLIRTLISSNLPLDNGQDDPIPGSSTFPQFLGVRELAKLASVSPSTVSKTLPTLVADGAIKRDSKGNVVSVNKRQLLDRWTIDYRILKSNDEPQYYVAPRGLDKALEKLLNESDVAVTGSWAGKAWLPDGVASVIPVTQLVIYASDPKQIVRKLGLLRVLEPSEANTIVLTPQDPDILTRPTQKDYIPVASLPIVLADLLTLPGRYPQQAEALMDALGKTDPSWRAL